MGTQRFFGLPKPLHLDIPVGEKITCLSDRFMVSSVGGTYLLTISSSRFIGHCFSIRAMHASRFCKNMEYMRKQKLLLQAFIFNRPADL